jgi:small-conductance mechanosensitive channel
MADAFLRFGERFPQLLPFLAGLAVVTFLLAAGYWFLIRRGANGTVDNRVLGQAGMLLITAFCLVVVVLVLPVRDATRGQLLSLFGLVITAVIALSSTTFVSNIMAGLMLRALKNFRPGDFVHVGDAFGRVTERGLFHVEIQTADRDLTTLPNLYVITNPVKVVRASGTIVSARLSLGYDTATKVVEPLLLEAARRAELQDPFVQVVELGNFAVTYRIAGFLRDVKQLLTARSRLHVEVLDVLHAAGIEVASPTIMEQRPLAPGTAILPREAGVRTPVTAPSETPEARIFDKADRAEVEEELRERLRQATEEIEERQAAVDAAKDEHARAAAARQLQVAERRKQTLEVQLQPEDQKKED